MAFLNPAALIREMHLRSDATVVDLGAGSGALSRAAAHRATDGKVYAVEVNKEILGRIAGSARSEGLTNIFPVWGDIEAPHGTKLADTIADVAILSNVLFQTEHPLGAILETKRILKSHGEVFVIDWTDSFAGLGPRPESVITEKKMKELWGGAGFLFEKKIEAGDHHYGLVFVKP